MSSSKKVNGYYDQFDEWARLDSPAGILEKEEVLRIVSNYVPKGGISWIWALGLAAMQ